VICIAKEDGWDTDPFTLTEVNGRLYGRGSTDDKGPVLSWLWVIMVCVCVCVCTIVFISALTSSSYTRPLTHAQHTHTHTKGIRSV